MKKLGSCCYSRGGREAEKSRGMPLLEGGHSCLHSPGLESEPLSCREQTPVLSVVLHGTWISPLHSPNHDLLFKTTGHKSLRERFASPFILRPPNMRELKDPGGLRMSGTNAYVNIGTIKGQDRAE